jgi:hypothetical protein
MNRRDVLKFASIVAIPAYGSAVLADCRDENGMIGPDGDDMTCLDLSINHFRSLGGQGKVTMLGRALFGFGAYEHLLQHQKERKNYAFEYYGMQYRIVVTRLSIDVNRELGCVVCEVNGKLYQ